MLHSAVPAADKRAAFRAGLASGRLLRFPGAFSPLSALLIARHGFEGVYVSGAVVSADLGLPDIGLTTLTEVAGRAQQIARVTALPALVDADTGFGEPMNAARTVQVLEDAGVAGLHIEDQVNPKRCGHLDGKDVVDRDTAVQRIKAAVAARRDPAFVIAARTDAAAVNGIADAIDRAKAYADAGADLIFPEAMAGEADFERFRAAVDTPILANMTEFGKTRLLDAATLENLGVNVVIYPVTLLRLAMRAADAGLAAIAAAGTQEGLLEAMQHRRDLYELLDYQAYNAFDTSIFNFRVLGGCAMSVTGSVTAPEVRKGLAGVYADTTAVSMVNPETNSLTYRGYPVQELCRRCSFEQVAYLLWHGELPTPDQLAAQNRAERAQRALDPLIAASIRDLPVTAHPMDILRTAVSLLGAADPTENDNSPAACRAKALRLFAVLPAVVAMDHRRRRGLDPVPPRDDLGFAANFLYMTFGKVPEPQIVTAFETSLILYAEHGFNASTFTARVVTSTLSDTYSAVTAAIGALKGPLHGGANEAVMHMMEEIGTADRVGEWLERALADKRKIMGFGHRVYKNGDSRVPTMRAALGEIAALRGGQNLVDIYEALARAVYEAKGLHPNLDYPAGPAYHLIGFDTPAFTPIFVAARLPGWTAHIAEQLAEGSLIRPLAAYDGPAERHLAA